MSQAEFVPPSFGTDGLRGRAGQAPIDPITMRRVGAALGLWLQQRGPEHKRVLLGHDGRASAGWIMECLAEGMAATDVVAIDLGLITTPGLAYCTRSETAVAGIMISASHNPAQDNGIKIFDHDGQKLDDATESEIASLSADAEFDQNKRARIKEDAGLKNRYAEHLLNLFQDLDLSGRKIALDAAHGAGSHLASMILEALGAEVIAVASKPDGKNINAGVGALHPSHLAKVVLAQQADFGICLDGDGDRGMFIDEQGRVHDGDSVLALLGPQMLAQGQLPANTLVATVMSNLGLYKVLQSHGIKVHQTPVGDRAVVQAMRQHGYALGGEQSGHIILAGDGQHTGDGIFTALKLMATPKFFSPGPAQALGAFQSFPQLLINVKVSDKPDLAPIASIQEAVQQVNQALGDEGRVLLRYSGTENLCRVMVEGPDAAQVRQHAEKIADAVRQELGQQLDQQLGQDPGDT